MMSAGQNPHFNNIERAPYELGSLLLKFAKRLTPHEQLSNDDLLKVDAIECHAQNSRETVLDGIEAVGDLLYVASGNETSEIEPRTLADIGRLIRYLAVEAQFLCGLEEEAAGVRMANEKKGAK